MMRRLSWNPGKIVRSASLRFIFVSRETRNAKVLPTSKPSVKSLSK